MPCAVCSDPTLFSKICRSCLEKPLNHGLTGQDSAFPTVSALDVRPLLELFLAPLEFSLSLTHSHCYPPLPRAKKLSQALLLADKLVSVVSENKISFCLFIPIRRWKSQGFSDTRKGRHKGKSSGQDSHLQVDQVSWNSSYFWAENGFSPVPLPLLSCNRLKEHSKLYPRTSHLWPFKELFLDVHCCL